jgi:excisionase family DNA binding protein
METLPQAPPAAFSVPGAAAQLSVSRSFVYLLIKRGEIRTVKLGSRTLIPASEIARLLAADSDQK